MNKLQEQRNKKGFSQSQLSNMSGVGIRAIQQYEINAKDINKARIGTVYRLARILGCNMSDIIDTDKEDRIMNKIELVERIKNNIEKEAMKTGRMGTESVSITLMLTDEEKDLFRETDEFDTPHFWYEFDGRELTISYTEDVE